MSWTLLVIAGLLEVVWVIGLKYTEGFTRPGPTVITLLAMTFSFGLLGIAVKGLEIGTAYAVWTGIGTVGAALLGIMLLGESASALRLISILLILAGIVGLRLIPSA